MRILLIQPDAPATVGFRTVALPEPLHLEMMAALLPEHEMRILDMRLDNDLEAALRSFGPQLVAITALIPEVYAAQQVLQQVKSFSAEIFTIVGGHHATLVPKGLLPASGQCDCHRRSRGDVPGAGCRRGKPAWLVRRPQHLLARW
jgi:hypothetical protein